LIFFLGLAMNGPPELLNRDRIYSIAEVFETLK